MAGVSDGNTLAARYNAGGSYEQFNRRIAAVDAPEKSQPIGQRGKQVLSDLRFQQTASIYRRSTARYGRTVADIECRDQNVVRHMIAGGWAWVYDHYAELEDAPLYNAQDVVREAKQRLWRDPAALAP